MKKKDPNKYPKGWNAKRVRALIDYYENQTDEEAVAEDDAMFERALKVGRDASGKRAHLRRAHPRRTTVRRK